MKQKGMKTSEAYQGRTFFFFGRAAKPLEELPNLNPCDYILCPGTRPAINKEELTNPDIKLAVEKAMQEFHDKGLI